MKKRLGINTATGIINIILGIFALAAFFIILDVASNMELLDLGLEVEDIIGEGQLLFFAFAWLVSIGSIVMSIISIVQSKKHGISMLGPILALCGSSGTLILCTGLAIITGPLTIAGGIVGLIQSNVKQNYNNSGNRQEPGQIPLSYQGVNVGQQNNPVQSVNLGQQVNPVQSVNIGQQINPVQEVVSDEIEVINVERSADDIEVVSSQQEKVTSSIGTEDEWKL